MIKDFKAFVVRGNVVDLAVGVIMGAAFGKIVSSLVADVLMPPLGMLLGKADFSSLFISMNGQHYASLDEAKKAGAPTLNFGVFVNSVVDFVVVAFVVFLVVRAVSRMMPAAPAVTTMKDCPQCLMSVPLAARKCGHCTSAI
jgi:large conductance mechanosensitive channel